MPGFVGGPDGERAWERAKGIILKQYPQLKGADADDAPKAKKDKFYALVTTVYKSVCRGKDYNCAPMKSESMGELLNRLSLLEGEGVGDLLGELAEEEGGEPSPEEQKKTMKVGFALALAGLGFVSDTDASTKHIDKLMAIQKSLDRIAKAMGVSPAEISRVADRLFMHESKFRTLGKV